MDSPTRFACNLKTGRDPGRLPFPPAVRIRPASGTCFREPVVLGGGYSGPPGVAGRGPSRCSTDVQASASDSGAAPNWQVSTGGSPDGIVLTVHDDGVGIAEADLPRVFEAFFTPRSTVGAGIGLFVAKQFVEGHGGRIEIESRQSVEDHGTTVRVFLPISTTYDSSGEGVRAKD
jgi:hypothetical protein